MTIQKNEKEEKHSMVIGMACEFPGSPNINEFWSLLESNKIGIRSMPDDRWGITNEDTNMSFLGHANGIPGKSSTLVGGSIQDLDRFDNFFLLLFFFTFFYYYFFYIRIFFYFFYIRFFFFFF